MEHKESWELHYTTCNHGNTCCGEEQLPCNFVIRSQEAGCVDLKFDCSH